jgi:pyruvate formate lyase activating enzyme
VTAFHADYKMTDRRDTSRDDLLRAAAIAHDGGLRFVYAGNRPGEVGDLEDTRCPSCHATVVSRVGYHVKSYALRIDGTCARCGTKVPGRWDQAFAGQIADRPFLPDRRLRIV